MLVVLSRTTIDDANARALTSVAIFKNTESVLVKFDNVNVGLKSLVKLSQFAMPVSEEFLSSITGLPGSVSSTVKGVAEADPSILFPALSIKYALKFITSPSENPVICSKSVIPFDSDLPLTVIVLLLPRSDEAICVQPTVDCAQ